MSKERTVGRVQAVRPKVYPVTSADEWFARTGNENWPFQLGSEGQLNVSNIGGYSDTPEALLQDLKKHARILTCLLATTKPPPTLFHVLVFRSV